MRLFLSLICAAAWAQPTHVPPKRSSQIVDGFGINSDLPRQPYLPWDAWWWTRMFDAGASWIRIGQYENSSDYTSWDWVEQKRGVFGVAPEVDDYVDSLVENGVKVQVQLMYGNPMYTSPGGKRVDSIVPKPGSFHNDDRSIDSVFWPPKTPDQIAAFLRYVTWMVNHFKGRIHYWALWNEQDIGYWNYANPEEYGRLLAAFAPAVHQTDSSAKVIYGGQADPTSDFAKRVLDECKCASQIDVFAYHTYPGYGKNVHPESMDSGAYGVESPAKLRALVRGYPGIRKDIEFWDDEFNSIPSWKGSDESVQAKYIPRGILYNHAAVVKTFVWLLTAGVDGNEYDDFGFIHGKRDLPDDFTPQPVYYAYQNTNALFADTKLDASIGIEASVRRDAFLHYGFRNRNGKAIVAYWVAAHSNPGGSFAPMTVNLKLKNSGIVKPVLIDVVSGQISPVTFKGETIEGLPLRDSVMAIADASYFDWAVLPEAPSGLRIHGLVAGDVLPLGQFTLQWEGHELATGFVIEGRRNRDKWEQIGKVDLTTEFKPTIDPSAKGGGEPRCFRVRAVNRAGSSGYSNVVCVSR
jgi:hypothetical protein